MKLYIAGAMSGLPDLNYPAFHAEAARLRTLGYKVENPAENPKPPCGSWEGYMRLGIAQLVTCYGVVVLPGWKNSKGAVAEVNIATMLQMPVFKPHQITHSIQEFMSKHHAELSE